MPSLSILIAPNPILKSKAKPIPKVDDETRQLIDDMLETMYAAPGIGLAANQVGVLKRIVVLDVARDGEAPQPLALVNPEIRWQSKEEATISEGCLSIPDQYADVTRPAEVQFVYLDRDGQRREKHASGLLATCVQHEIDHLNGILFVDHLSPLKRNILMRKLSKAQKAKTESAM